jgi:hypothetical protein
MEMSCPLSRFEERLHKTQAAPLPGLRRSVAQVIGRATLTLVPIHACLRMPRAPWRAAVVSWQLNANQFSSGNDAKSLDGGRGSTQFGGEGSYCRREKM